MPVKQPVDAQGTTSAREADGALASVRDRIREFRTVRAGDLLPDPRNPALHGDRQVSDVRANLADLGNLDVLKVVERPEGLVIVDGHLRRNLLADQEVRVAVLDLTPREQAKALLSFNRLAQLAEHDPLKVEALSAEVEDLSGTGYTVEEVRAEVAEATVPSFEPVSVDEQGRLDQLSPIMVKCPECGHEFNTREADAAA